MPLHSHVTKAARIAVQLHDLRKPLLLAFDIARTVELIRVGSMKLRPQENNRGLC